jgi:dTDP-4-dehydrorhamnose 3,5-epimerase-like enzyme
MVGAGAVVTHDVPANATVVGNPARIVGYIDDSSIAGAVLTSTGAPDTAQLPRGVDVLELPVTPDLRGSLVANEIGGTLPFTPERYFVVFDVPSQHVRGEHAHRHCWQFLTCVHGRLTVHVDDGERRAEVVLDTAARGVVVPPMVWASQFNYSADALLLVLASLPYDPDDYIRDYGEFLALVRPGPADVGR